MPGLAQLRMPRSPHQSTEASRAASRALYSQGTCLLGDKKPAEAEAYFREALSLNPDDADVLNNLGTAVWEQGRASEAMAYYLSRPPAQSPRLRDLEQLGIVLWTSAVPSAPSSSTGARSRSSPTRSTPR